MGPNVLLPTGEFYLPLGNVAARGHVELSAFFADKHRTTRSVRHLATDHLVWEEDSVVRHWSSVIVFTVVEGAAALRFIGNYEDIVTKTAEGWRFARRHATLIEVQGGKLALPVPP